jgi:hypothetical protein
MIELELTGNGATGTNEEARGLEEAAIHAFR